MRVDSVGGDFESLKSLPMLDISGIFLVDKNPGHHEVCNDDGDNNEVIMVDRVGTLFIKVIGKRLSSSGASKKLMSMSQML